MIVFVMATCLHLTSATDSAIQVIFGGSRFSKSSVGTSGSCMLSEWRDKIFNPLVTRVAQKVMALISSFLNIFLILVISSRTHRKRLFLSGYFSIFQITGSISPSSSVHLSVRPSRILFYTMNIPCVSVC